MTRRLNACLIIIGLWAGWAHADSTCYQWSGNQLPASIWQTSPGAAIQDVLSYCSGLGPNGGGVSACAASTTFCPGTGTPTCANWTIESGPTPNTAHPAYAWVLGYDATNNVGTVTHRTTSKTLLNRANPVGCPACPAAGTQKNLRSDQDSPENATICQGGCEYSYKPSYISVNVGSGGGTRVGARGIATGSACGQTGTTLTSGTDESCGSASGNIACIKDPPLKAAEVNGDNVTPSQVPAGSCVGYESGAMACRSTAAAPPAPDNGTPGTPAAPDAQVSSNGITVNYYTNTTVNNSTGDPASSPPSGSGNPIGTPGGGDGGDGEDTSCPEGATCDGTLPGGGEFEEVCTFQECTETLLNRIQASPLVSSVSSVASSWPEGSCPDWSFELWGEDMSFSTSLCTFWEGIGAVLGGIMLIVFGWLGTRVVLSA